MQERENVKSVAKRQLEQNVTQLEAKLQSDVVAAFGPIQYGAEHNLRHAVDTLPDDERRQKVAVILNTVGGVVEIVERMVDVLRQKYKEVDFYVPDVALSAGTIFVMSGDAIHMNYFSRLGPIDPQFEREGKLVPAVSYLAQFNRFVEKSRNGTLTDAELSLLMKLDLAELHQYEQARNLAVTLLKKWLTTYKFKNWRVTESRKKTVTDKMKKERAEEIATALSDNERWHSHARGISMETLRDELKLQIDDFDRDPELSGMLLSYFSLFADYVMNTYDIRNMVMHTRNYL